MADGLDLASLREKDTWKAFGIGIVLFCVIAYTSLAIFGVSSSLYGVSDRVEAVPDFEAMTMNRTGIDDSVSDDSGMFRLSSLRGSVVVLDFMSIDCTNCHLVQAHIEDNLDSWHESGGEYPVVVISVATWYNFDSYDKINETFGDPESERHMSWPIVNGASDSVILENGERGDLTEHYSTQSLPLALVIDHEGYVVAKEGTGSPLDGWVSFDGAVEKAIDGEAGNLRFGVEKVDRSLMGVFLVGLFLGVLVYFSPCAFPVLPSYISYCLTLGVREDELREAGKIEGSVPGSLEIGGFAALGQLTFFGLVGLAIYGLDGIVSLSGYLYDIAVAIALILVFLGTLMLLGWTSNMLSWVQKLIDKHMTSEDDEIFSPRRNMYLWGIGYSAASVDCTAAAVFPFMAWLAVVGKGTLIMGMSGLMISVSFLMVAVTVLVGMGRGAMIESLRSYSAIVKATGAWMMIFAGFGLLTYLTQPGLVTVVLA